MSYQNLTILRKKNFLSLIFILTLLSLNILTTCLKEGEDEEELELIFVYQHIRHGARGPSASYNSLFKDGIDEFRVSWEGEGDGELTLVGKREHYDIGVRNRHKYGMGPNGLKLINFSHYNPEEVLFHVTDYNRTHQSLNSELIGMFQPGILGTLTELQVNGSLPPNDKVWFEKQNESLYQEILEEIQNLGNKTIIDNIPVFNVKPFPANRTFNLENNCHNLTNMRLESIKGKDEILYSYFVKHQDELREFFQFDNNSAFTDIVMMNSITDHYISDYKNYKDLSIFHNETGIDLDEFMEKCGQFYLDWMYNYYCTNVTCAMESSRLMEDLLGYMKRRIQYYPKTTYYAPKLVIDCGHDTTVAPMQMYMYETFKDKDYGIRTQYCGFACNLYFELYKTKNGPTKYYVKYYIDEDLVYTFDYDEFDEAVRARMYSQDNITDYCITNEEKEEQERKQQEEEERKRKEEEEKNKEESFAESFENHKLLWIGLFTFILTTVLGIIGMVLLAVKIKKLNPDAGRATIVAKEAEMKNLGSKLITQSEAV